MKRLSPRAILAIGWLVFLLYAYPGYLNSEAVDEMIDARNAAIADWHSPMLTEVWRLVHHLIAGPAGMLVLQSLMLLVGAYHLVRRTLNDRAAAFTSCGLLLFPPLVATTGLISPEAQLAGFFLVGLHLLTKDARPLKLAGLLLILVGAAMRPGGSLAALPLIMGAFVWNSAHSRLRRRGVALGAWLAVTLLARGLTWTLVETETRRPDVRLAALDVAGVIAKAGPISDAELHALLEVPLFVVDHDVQASVRRAYAKSHSLISGPDRTLETPQTEAGKDDLIDARWSLMRAHPGAYLAHRARQALRVLGFVRGGQWRPLEATAVGNPAQREPAAHAARHSLLQKYLVVPVRWLSKGALFRPWVYLAIALILLPFAIRRRARPVVMLLASGVLYELALCFVTSEWHFRDSHWLLVTTLISAILLIARPAPPAD